MKQINIALVGYQFMGKAHSNGWSQVGRFFDLPVKPVLHTLAGRNAAAMAPVAARWGWANCVTDLSKIYNNPDIDLVDIATPNNAHPEAAIAAAEAGKAVACEKPLACTLPEARRMVQAITAAKVPNYVWFNYRRVPAVNLARTLIESGRLGAIYHVRAVYLQDWIKDPNFPLVWRLSKAVSGSGALGDLAAHIIDLARYLTGEELTEVSGLTHTFIKERPIAEATAGLSGQASGSQKMGQVDVDDTALFLARFSGGGVGTFEATRFATGSDNANRIEIHGAKGAIRFNFEDFNMLEFWDETLPRSERGWRKISVTHGEDPYSGKYWPAGHVIGYEHTFINTAADILTHLAGSSSAQPAAPFHADFVDGLRCQEVLEAVSLSSQRRCWVDLRELR